MNRTLLIASAVSCLVFACGSGNSGDDIGQSGISKLKSLQELTDSEASRLCEWSLATEGGAGHLTKCPDGTERQTHTMDRCLENIQLLRELELPCTISVDDAEKCSLETQEDACANSKPTCDRVNTCAKSAKKK